MSAIVLDRVSKSYGDRTVLEPTSLTVARGRFVALVGGSGAGKTTLLKLMNGLSAPSSGRVLVEGADIAGRPGPQLRRGIGYVFQEVGLFPHLTVGQNIGITPELLGWPAVDIAARIDELLDLVALPRGIAARAPSELSGGQRQRVGVARALAARPSILLMDEPFGALDPVTRVALADDVRTLHESQGLTTVMVTHDVGEALLLADEVVVMAGGKVLAHAPPRDLLAGHPDPIVADLIGAPRRQAQRLAELVRG